MKFSGFVLPVLLAVSGSEADATSPSTLDSGVTLVNSSIAQSRLYARHGPPNYFEWHRFSDDVDGRKDAYLETCHKECEKYWHKHWLDYAVGSCPCHERVCREDINPWPQHPNPKHRENWMKRDHCSSIWKWWSYRLGGRIKHKLHMDHKYTPQYVPGYTGPQTYKNATD